VLSNDKTIKIVVLYVPVATHEHSPSIHRRDPSDLIEDAVVTDDNTFAFAFISHIWSN
jgi:hypothetical protein